VPRNYFTPDEITLCAYIAIYGRSCFDEHKIVKITGRPLASIKMKVQNIAAMLREEQYECHSSISSLTGLPQGLSGRRTNWSTVHNLPLSDKAKFLARCEHIFEIHRIN
jgi:hypothetical protein